MPPHTVELSDDAPEVGEEVLVTVRVDPEAVLMESLPLGLRVFRADQLDASGWPTDVVSGQPVPAPTRAGPGIYRTAVTFDAPGEFAIVGELFGDELAASGYPRAARVTVSHPAGRESAVGTSTRPGRSGGASWPLVASVGAVLVLLAGWASVRIASARP